MIQAGPIIEQLFSDTDATTPERQAQVLRRFNISYYDIARMLSWAEMRRSVSITVASDADYLMPGDMLGVDGIYRLATTSSEFRMYDGRMESQLGILQDGKYRYTFPSVVTSPLSVAQSGATINKWSNSISGITGGATGEYIAFAKRMGIYKMASATTIEATFLEESVQSGGYIVRLPGTKYLRLYDREVNRLADTVTLDYWALPAPITDPSQYIALPQADVLLMHALVRCFGVTYVDEQRADRYRREFRDALATAKSLNPSYLQPVAPENPNGSVAGYGASP